MTTLLLLAVLTQASPPNAIVMSRRTGVTTEQSAAVVALLAAEFKKAGVALAPGVVDGTSCKGKKSCLVSLANKQGLKVAVLLQVAKVLDDGVMTAEAVAVEADGERLGLVDYEGPFKDTGALVQRFAILAGKVKATTNAPEPAKPPAVAAAAPTPAPTPAPVAAPPPAPAPAAPPPVAAAPPSLTPAPTPVAEAPPAVTQPAAPGFLTPGRGVGLTLMGLGVVSGVVGVVAGLNALSSKGQVERLCPPTAQCNDPAAFTAFDSNGRSISLATGAFVGAGLGLVVGLVLVIVAAPTPAAQAWLDVSAGGLSVHL